MGWTAVPPVPRRCGSLAAQHFFALADDLAHEWIHSIQEKTIQSFCITKENIKSLGTFLFDSTLKKDLSPASLTLLPPLFFEGAGRNCLFYKVFSEKVEAAEAGGAGEERFLFQEKKRLPWNQQRQFAAESSWRRRVDFRISGRLLMSTSKPRRSHGQPQVQGHSSSGTAICGNRERAGARSGYSCG